MTQAFPLQWPRGRPRTKARQDSAFRVNPTKAFEELLDEVARFDVKGLVISSNIPTRLDGTPYRDGLKELIEDPGIAVYFTRKDRLICLCCDHYRRPWENVRALSKAVEGFRAMERHGAGQVLDQAFEGFTALPTPSAGLNEPQERHWTVVLGLETEPVVTEAMINAAYKAKARAAGGATTELNLAKEAALQAVGAGS